MRTLKTAMIVLVLALCASIASAQQQPTTATPVAEPELVPDTSIEVESLLQQIHDLYPGTEEQKTSFAGNADKIYVGKDRVVQLTKLRDMLKPAESAPIPVTTPTASSTTSTSADQQIASEALVGHENEYHNPPCGNDAPFNELTPDGKLIPRCFAPLPTSVTVVGKAPQEPAPAKVHVPDAPKTEDPTKVHVQDGTSELDYKKLVEEKMRGLIDDSKKPNAVSARNQLMDEAAEKEALERYVGENCGSGIFHRAKNTFECARVKAKLTSIADKKRLEGYNRLGNLTGCVGTPAQIVNKHVVESLRVDGAQMGLLIKNDSDLVWSISSPSRIHTNGPAGPIAVNICPHSTFTPNFTLTALFGPNSGYTSSRESSNRRREKVVLVANSEPLPNGEVLHDEFSFTLDTNGYVTSDSKTWYIGHRVQSSVSFLPKEGDGEPVESQPKSGGAKSGGSKRPRTAGGMFK